VIDHYFGNEVYFLCFEYMSEFHMEPSDYAILFDFLRYKKTKNIIRGIAEEYIKSARGGS
jgi:hypothetical protein